MFSNVIISHVSNVINLVLRDSETNSENVSLIRLSVSDGRIDLLFQLDTYISSVFLCVCVCFFFFFLLHVFIVSGHTYGLELLENPMFFRVDGNQRENFLSKIVSKGVFSKVLIILMDVGCFNILHKIGKKSTWRNGQRFCLR